MFRSSLGIYLTVYLNNNLQVLVSIFRFPLDFRCHINNDIIPRSKIKSDPNIYAFNCKMDMLSTLCSMLQWSKTATCDNWVYCCNKKLLSMQMQSAIKCINDKPQRLLWSIGFFHIRKFSCYVDWVIQSPPSHLLLKTLKNHVQHLKLKYEWICDNRSSWKIRKHKLENLLQLFSWKEACKSSGNSYQLKNAFQC